MNKRDCLNFIRGFLFRKENLNKEEIQLLYTLVIDTLYPSKQFIWRNDEK